MKPFSRYLGIIAAAAACWFAAGVHPRAQNSAALEVVDIQPNVHMIAGDGGNVVVQTGPDGVVVIDTGAGAQVDALVASVKALSPQPIRYIINTSPDADHVGGNEKLSAAGRAQGGGGGGGGQQGGLIARNPGAPIIAQERVLLRMSTAQPAVSGGAWPTETFTDTKDLYYNREGIQIVHVPNAHSDGDSLVFLRRSDVLLAGDVFDNTRFPVIDTAHGGTVQGLIEALNTIIDLAIPPIPLAWQEGGTQIIPGHGRVCEEADVVEYRDMVVIVRDVIQSMIDKQMTLEQIKAAKPTLGYNVRFGATSGPWTTDMFVEAVYKSLVGKKK